MSDSEEQLAAWIRQACLLEATVRKPGNVHPGASFDDLTYDDFRAAATAIAPVLSRSGKLGVGESVLQAMQATRAVTPTNVNLGMILLLAPLAAIPPEQSLDDGIRDLLAALTVHDAERVYEAIRLAVPGGLGKVDHQDVSAAPTGTLLEVMRLAAHRDTIAAQYANGFEDVLEFGVSRLSDCADFPRFWESAITDLHLALMVRRPDTLIARKCGPDVAKEAARRAQTVLAAGGPESPERAEAVMRLDRWLRADGHRRNPGATADMVAATLFAALREGVITAPDEFVE